MAVVDRNVCGTIASGVCRSLRPDGRTFAEEVCVCLTRDRAPVPSDDRHRCASLIEFTDPSGCPAQQNESTMPRRTLRFDEDVAGGGRPEGRGSAPGRGSVGAGRGSAPGRGSVGAGRGSARTYARPLGAGRTGAAVVRRGPTLGPWARVGLVRPWFGADLRSAPGRGSVGAGRGSARTYARRLGAGGLALP